MLSRGSLLQLLFLDMPVVGRIERLHDLFAVQEHDLACANASIIHYPEGATVVGEILRIGKMMRVVPHLLFGESPQLHPKTRCIKWGRVPILLHGDESEQREVR